MQLIQFFFIIVTAKEQGGPIVMGLLQIRTFFP